MPYQSRGFWRCDFCNLTLDSLEEARQHEVEECQKNPIKPQQQNQQQQQQQQNQQQQQQQAQQQQQQQYFQAQYFQPQQRALAHISSGYYQPVNMPPLAHLKQDDAYEANPNQRSIPLMGINESSQMNPDDSVACQSIELFESGPAEASDMDLRTSFPFLTAGLAGLRCIHCSSNPTTVKDAIYFPSNIDSMSDGVRRLSEQHLGKCAMAPSSVRGINQQATEKRRANQQERGSSSWQDDERSRAALRDWCHQLCKRLGIVDKGSNNSGLVFLSYPTEMYGQGLGMPGRPRPGMMAMAGESLAPAARRRDRNQMTAAGDFRASVGYESYAGQGGEAYYGPSDTMPMAHQSHDASQGQAGNSPHRGYQQPQMPSHEWNSNFPFFQEASGGWSCKYCCHIPPQQRDPQSSWSPPNLMPPPPQYMDQHLSMCRGYHQSMSAHSMFAGGPSPPQFHFMSQQFPGGFGGLQQPGWEVQGMHGANQGQPMGYLPAQGSQESQAASQAQLPPTSPYPHTPHQTPGASKYADTSGRRVMSQPRAPPAQAPRADANDAVVQQAIDFLAASDREASYAAGTAGTFVEQLVLDEDKLLLTDYFFYLMKQLRICRFSEADRKTRGGKREKIQIGFGGLQCIHCTEANNSRKFFWSNVDRLANSFAEIPGHVLKCRHCPQPTKDALYQLKQLHPEQMARLPRGSQKVFFRRMWRRLHDEDPQATSPEQPSPAQGSGVDFPGVGDVKSPAEAKLSGDDTSPSGTTGSDESVLLMQRSTKEAAKALADSISMSFPPSPTSRVLLAVPEDKEWLSDTDCFIRRQIEVFCASSEDVEVARSDRKFPVREGQVGIRCIHCALSKHGFGARGTGVAYPFSVSGIYESVREFQRLHLDSCGNLPVEMKAKLSDLKGSTSLSSVLRKYYVLAAKALGLKDTRDGIRAGGDSVPIGSQAAFAFSEGSSSISEEMHRSGTVPAFAQSASLSPSMTPLESRKRKPLDTSDDGSDSDRKRPHTSQKK